MIRVKVNIAALAMELAEHMVYSNEDIMSNCDSNEVAEYIQDEYENITDIITKNIIKE